MLNFQISSQIALLCFSHQLLSNKVSIAEETTLILTVENLIKTPGKLYIGFLGYSMGSDKNEEKLHVFRKVVDSNGLPTLKLTLGNIPEGEYMIVAYQDIDENNDLKLNWLGLPKEPIGYSNNFIPKAFNLPNFEKCKIKINSVENEHTIVIIP